MAPRIPILIMVDCEPDPRHTHPNRPEPWPGFENLFALLAEQRSRMATGTGRPAQFGWFWRMDPQIEVTYGTPRWAVETYRRQIEQARMQGDDIGLHIHGWRWDAASQNWIADYGDPAWIEHCIRVAFSEFEQNFGRRCEIVRFGDGWFSDQATGLFERLSVRIDLTLEPDMPGTCTLAPGEVVTGSIPDRAGVPRRPYHPSLQDFRVPDDNGATRMWMLPVTTGQGFRRRRGWRRLLPRTLAPPDRELVQLNLSHSRRRFAPVFERAIADQHCPYAAILARSDGGIHPRAMKAMARNIRYMLRHRRAEQFVFVTPTDALAMLTGMRNEVRARD